MPDISETNGKTRQTAAYLNRKSTSADAGRGQLEIQKGDIDSGI
jgi:hypothetical protein